MVDLELELQVVWLRACVTDSLPCGSEPHETMVTTTNATFLVYKIQKCI